MNCDVLVYWLLNLGALAKIVFVCVLAWKGSCWCACIRECFKAQDLWSRTDIASIILPLFGMKWCIIYSASKGNIRLFLILNYGCEFGSTVSGLSFVNLQSPFPENDAIYLITIIIFGTRRSQWAVIHLPWGKFIIQRLLCQRILVMF